ncbi:MAG: sterol desaturase family protein [Bacteroidota bacterium]
MSSFYLILIFLGTCIAMEGWAWIMHKYILHGPLWFLHKSHHSVNPGWFEWNDLVSLIYGIAAAALIILGIEKQIYLLPIGAGITVYGIFYFLFHDVIIHRRIKIKYSFKNPYINRLIRAHKIHHKTLTRQGSEAFGFLYALPKFAVKRVKKQRSNL